MHNSQCTIEVCAYGAWDAHSGKAAMTGGFFLGALHSDCVGCTPTQTPFAGKPPLAAA